MTGQALTVKQKKVNPVDKAKLLNMYFVNGVKEADIARYFGVCRQAINKQLQPFKSILHDRGLLDNYRQQYPAILSSIELELLNELVDKPRLKKATTGNIAYALDKITMHRRLHDGLSTDNLSLHAEVKASRDRLEALKAKLDMDDEGGRGGEGQETLALSVRGYLSPSDHKP